MSQNNLIKVRENGPLLCTGEIEVYAEDGYLFFRGLLPADRVIAAENAWVTPLPPEGAAAIVHRDAGRAPEMAAHQQITAAALGAAGAVDAIVPEIGDWPAAVGEQVAAALGARVRGRDERRGGPRGRLSLPRRLHPRPDRP